VSAKSAIETIRAAKQEMVKTNRVNGTNTGFTISCEVMPHHLCLTEEDARKLGEKTWGRVNPPLRCEEDRKALIQALTDGAVDAIATDHAPHSTADKEFGKPGFSGFETAFAACYTELVRRCAKIDLKRLSSLMSANPARLLGFSGSQRRGRILSGYRADLVIIDPNAKWIVDTAALKTRGKNSPFSGRELAGKILMTLNRGRVVFES
jgi:dihydroorotase